MSDPLDQSPIRTRLTAIVAAVDASANAMDTGAQVAALRAYVYEVAEMALRLADERDRALDEVGRLLATRDCSACKGSGRLYRHTVHLYGEEPEPPTVIPCQACGGTGRAPA